MCYNKDTTKGNEVLKMKVYILYILSDYAHAIFMSKDRKDCELIQQTLLTKKNTWIEEYDFSKQSCFDLDCD